MVEHEPHVIHTAKKPEPEPLEDRVPDYATFCRSRSAGSPSRANPRRRAPQLLQAAAMAARTRTW